MSVDINGDGQAFMVDCVFWKKKLTGAQQF